MPTIIGENIKMKYWNDLSKIAIKNHLKIYPPLFGDHRSAGLWLLKNAEYARWNAIGLNHQNMKNFFAMIQIHSTSQQK